MGTLAVSAVLATIVVWCVLAGRLQARGLTAPIVFVAAGWFFADVLGLLDLEVEPELVRVIAEVTLVWVLFADASRVRLGQLRRDLSTYARLLGIGLPLTIAAGVGAAMIVLGFDLWAALLVAAALAPTDAALGAPVMSNPHVPEKVRRALNVESGLNDGIATPIVLVAIAGVAADQGIIGVESPGGAVLSLLVGLVVGLVVGGLGGWITRLARERDWLSAELAGPAVLALALLAYAAALTMDGNGFVAAFVGGLVFGNVAGPSGEKEVYFVSQSGDMAAMVSWLVFGALAVPVIQDQWDWTMLGYAVLSLTIVRMLPVAIALLGTGFDRFSVAFVGWFGPRGLASVIFALIALEDLHGAGADAVAVISLTVLLSVLAHGLSAVPLAKRFAVTRPRSASPELNQPSRQAEGDTPRGGRSR
ncbi:cation:proton antiporter [Nocardioides albus]|uniref:NhaP-type Na+/H+ or K+/H+ antiporter n=1 Tax=Nocardioides albus TaxID=1841 RepID=A0A7W5F7H1_9ACTN|nr:cation:proton antiporter [Nocardioides albus]MBB3087867.1 NhaP-type Na+/H+ or K+/H+ antiporter [Nocardioides albus]GGU20880.1 sodium:proton antiporter [Nocardioides albus]